LLAAANWRVMGRAQRKRSRAFRHNPLGKGTASGDGKAPLQDQAHALLKQVRYRVSAKMCGFRRLTPPGPQMRSAEPNKREAAVLALAELLARGDAAEGNQLVSRSAPHDDDLDGWD
jgi:hypothetical protein